MESSAAVDINTQSHIAKVKLQAAAFPRQSPNIEGDRTGVRLDIIDGR